MNRSPLSIALCAALATGLAAPTRAGDLHTVGSAGDFSTIQAAVDAAVDGDALLVAQGTYAGIVIDGKALSIFALPGAQVNVTRWVIVRNLAVHQTVVLHGVAVRGNVFDVSLQLENDEGHVRLQDCSFTAYPFSIPSYECFGPNNDGPPGARVQNCSRVGFVGCTFGGGVGAEQDDLVFLDCEGGRGGTGFECVNSTIALYECEVSGGRGGTAQGLSNPGDGGLGLHAVDSEVFASGGFVHGGGGGAYLDPPYGGAGGGGAVWLSDTSFLGTLDCELAGGLAGLGTYESIPGNSRVLEAPPVASASAPIDVTYRGDASDLVWIPQTLRAGFRFLPFGVWLTRFPYTPPTAVGIVPPSAELTVQLDLLSLPPGEVHDTLFLQGAAVALGGQRILASGRHVLSLDPTFGPDCNSNGTSDYLDVALGTSSDGNHNSVPDECE